MTQKDTALADGQSDSNLQPSNQTLRPIQHNIDRLLSIKETPDNHAILDTIDIIKQAALSCPHSLPLPAASPTALVGGFRLAAVSHHQIRQKMYLPFPLK
jgi:hypothetical protein